VTAAAVVGEAMASLVLADAFLEKFGADNIPDIASAVDAAATAIRARFVRAETSAPEPAQP
jgi:hypothetical protein